MSLLTRSVLRSRAAPICLRSNLLRPFHSTGARAALSESDHSLDDDHRKAAIDEHKDDQLQKRKEGKGHWKEELGSNSESAVKADREEITDAESDIEKLQKETSQSMEDNHDQAKK